VTEPVLRLAGDLAEQFRHRSPAEAAAAVAQHIRLFWDPRMRRALLSALDGEPPFDPLIRDTAELLRSQG
jgi:formate dehydrogenase subunit delta